MSVGHSTREFWEKIARMPMYEVSTLGRVRKLHKFSKPLILKVNVWGRYRQAHLSNNYEKLYIRVAYLVLEAFVGPRPEGLVCRHLDDNSLNDALSNLAWGTQYENVQDMVRNGKNAKGSKHGRSKLTEEQIVEIRKRSAAGETSPTIAPDFDISPRNVRRICARSHWKHVK